MIGKRRNAKWNETNLKFLLIGEMHIVKEDIIKSIQGYFDKTLSGCSIQAETSEKLVEPEQPHDTDESIDMNLMSFVSGMCDGM